jgi:cytochrome c oxidase subunit IV
MTHYPHKLEDHVVIPYRVYFAVWAGLIALTALTVAVSYVDMKNVTVLTAMLIATVKATLVLLYFMHIRFERPLYWGMILATLVTYAIFIGLTFSDYFYR